MYLLIWLGLFIVFAIFEGVTAGLVSIWFCLGALVGLLVASLGGSWQLQIIVFLLVSLVTMLLVRPLARKYMTGKTERTNADRILDAEAVVTEEINNLEGKGQVKVAGVYWTARSDGEAIIREGTMVRVLRIEGVKAIVTDQ